MPRSHLIEHRTKQLPVSLISESLQERDVDRVTQTFSLSHLIIRPSAWGTFLGQTSNLDSAPGKKPWPYRWNERARTLLVWRKASCTPSPWWMSMSMYSTRAWCFSSCVQRYEDDWSDIVQPQGWPRQYHWRSRSHWPPPSWHGEVLQTSWWPPEMNQGCLVNVKFLSIKLSMWLLD